MPEKNKNLCQFCNANEADGIYYRADVQGYAVSEKAAMCPVCAGDMLALCNSHQHIEKEPLK
jgi:hypothetical protein